MTLSANIVHQQSSSIGTGTFSLVAVNGRRSFNTAFGTGGTDVFWYFILNRDAAEWEEGTGHLSDASTLVRDTVISSSNSDNAVDFSAGTKEITSAVPYDFMVVGPGSHQINAANLATAKPAFGLGAINFGLAASVSGNALTIELKGADGNDPSATNPVLIPFQNVDITVGNPTVLSVQAATSLVVSSGSTLGTASGIPCRLWVVGFNDGGTFRLGVINCRVGGATPTQIYPLNEHGIASAVAEGGAGGADTAGVFYAGATVTDKALKVLGFITFESGQATAGTWASSPSDIRLFGPGCKLPGEVVQVRHLHEGTGSSTTSTSLTDVSNGGLSITPKSAANLIWAVAQAKAQVAAGGAGNNSQYVGSFVRDATTLLTSDVGVISASGTNMQTNGHIAYARLDAPGVTTSTTYKFRHRTTDADGAANTSSLTIMLQELMG